MLHMYEVVDPGHHHSVLYCCVACRYQGIIMITGTHAISFFSVLQSFSSFMLTARFANSRSDDVIKWKYFPRYWPFVRGIHRSPVTSPHKGQ